MFLSSQQTLIILLVIFGVLGLWRGVMREAITAAILFGTLLFLSVGGTGLLHDIIFVRLPAALSTLVFGTSTVTVAGPTATAPNPTGDSIFSVMAFGIPAILAFFIGHKYGGEPKSNQHRLGGLPVGAINGGALFYYLTNTFFPNSSSVVVNSPTATLMLLVLPILLVAGLLMVLFLVFR
ncbi:MAG TPA: hypothetical protein VF818_13440 [Ktedonobacterales bacterium]